MSTTLEVLAQLLPPDRASPDWDACARALGSAFGGMHCVIWAGGSISQMVGASSEPLRECFAWWESPSAKEIDYLQARDHPIGSMWHVPVAKLRKLEHLRERVLDPLDIRTGTCHGLVLAHNRAHVVGVLALYPQGDPPSDPDVPPFPPLCQGQPTSKGRQSSDSKAVSRADERSMMTVPS